MRIKTFMLVFALASLAFPQWNQLWSSPQLGYYTSCGYFSFKKANNQWENRFYTVDSNSIKIMQSGFNSTPQYVYNFTSAEKLAGAQIYSLGYDLTGDGIVEFYVLGYYGNSSNYRQGFRILDITNNSSVFQKEESGYSYSYPTIADINSDNLLECTFTKTVFPSYSTYTYEVYNTGIATGSTENPLKLQFRLNQNYPNPFNPSTTIEYSLESPAMVNIQIFDITGEVVKTLTNSYNNAGSYSVIWDGSDNSGNKVATGIYFYKLNAGASSQTKKMIFLK